MTADERQCASISDDASRGPRRWARYLHAVLTLCVGLFVVGVALNDQLMGMLQPILQALYPILYFMTSLAGCEVFMVVGFVFMVRAMRQSPAFTRGNQVSNGAFVWGSRLARAGLVPLAVGYFGFFWFYPSLLEEWCAPTTVSVGFFALLGVASVLFCSGIVLCGVAAIWAVWQWVHAVGRGAGQ
jgi:hypothetical protein